ILPHQCDSRDQKPMFAAEVVETSLQQRQDRAPTANVDRTRQGEMKAKVFEDVRVPPPIEIFDLAVAQGRRRVVVLSRLTSEGGESGRPPSRYQRPADRELCLAPRGRPQGIVRAIGWSVGSKGAFGVWRKIVRVPLSNPLR